MTKRTDNYVIAKLKRNMSKDNYSLRLIIILIIWMIFMAVTRFSQFYTTLNFQTMAAQFPEYGLMSLGVMVCMMTGGIDLSVVGIANVASISSALLMRSIGGSEDISLYWIFLAFLLTIIIGAILGSFNGFLVAKLKISPILATLGANTLYTGIGLVMTGGKAISDFPNTFHTQLTTVYLEYLFS